MPSSRSASGKQGLDHVAFAVTDMDVLRTWEEPLTDAGVEHSGISVTPVTGSVLTFRDPDNIQFRVVRRAGFCLVTPSAQDP